MQAARGREGRLRLPQPVGQHGHELCRDDELALDPGRFHGDGLESALAADPTGGRGVEVPAQPVEIDVAVDLDVDHVGGEVRRRVSGHGCDSLGTKESRASSSSWPGVRIVTAMGRPSTRISSGSSTAISSGSVSPWGSRTTSTEDAEYGGTSFTMIANHRRPPAHRGSSPAAEGADAPAGQPRAHPPRGRPGHP